MRNNTKTKHRLLSEINQSYDDEGPGMLGVAVLVVLLSVFVYALWQMFV